MRITYEFLKLAFIPRVALYGLGFDLGIGGSKGSSSSTTTLDKGTTSEESKTGTETSTGLSTDQQDSTGTTTGTGTKTAEGVETSTLSTLDEETQNTIKNLINDISLGDSGSQELLALLEERALGADDAFAGLVDPQVEEARRLQEQDLGSSVQALSRATGGGSKSNSLVAGFNLEGQRAVDSSIASLAATLGIDARNAATEEISGAFEAGLVEDQTTSSAVSALANVLKGADQTGTKSTASTESATNVEDVVQSLTSATTSEEVTAIIENLFAQENVYGTEYTKGKTEENSVGFGLSG